MTVAREDDAHRDRHLQRFPDTSRHSPTYQLGAITHRARFGIALAPSKSFRALAVALAQVLAAVWSITVLVEIGVTPQPKFKRVELEGDSEFVHRAFERIDSGRGTRRAHVAGGSKVKPRELVGIFRIGALVKQAGPAGLLPMEVL